MLLAAVSRPDICYAVNIVSRYMLNFNWNAVKIIFKYWNYTKSVRIKYTSTKNMNLMWLDFRIRKKDVGDVNTRKSTTGYVFKIGNGPVSSCMVLFRKNVISNQIIEATRHKFLQDIFIAPNGLFAVARFKCTFW